MMIRAGFGFLLSGLALSALTGAATAADYPDGMRGSYEWVSPTQCAPACEDAIGFEVGLRYVYSLGEHTMTAGGNSYSIEDKSHILEPHFRITDNYTSTFLRGSAGLAVYKTGTYTITPGGPVSYDGGTIASVGADFGWLPVSYGGVSAGLFAGYAYMNESPDMGYTTTPGARTQNAINIHAMRLGLSARADFDQFDISADAAVVPFALVNGTYGAYVPGSAEINGSVYGVQGEVMVGYKFTPQAILRVGARGSYLTGQAGLERAGATTQTTNLTFARVGLVGEFSTSF